MNLLFWILAKAELLSYPREHKIKELSSLLPEFLLILRHLVLLPQLLLGLQVEQWPTKHLKDFNQQYKDKQGCADVTKRDVGSGIPSIIVEVYQRDS